MIGQLDQTTGNKMRVRFITLGCKVNHYETQGIKEAMERARFREVAREKDDCEFVVINTCTVTRDADRGNRYWIRRARREHPGARIVLTGCYVERNRQEVLAIPGVDLVISNTEKSDIVRLLSAGCASPDIQDDTGEPSGEAKENPRHRYSTLPISRTEGLGRAYVKIQDGCNHACSFCKVVLVRGRSRSRSPEDITEEALRLRDSGYKEIVLTGIQLGAYGDEFSAPVALEAIVESIARIEGIERIRLSSIEPTDVTGSLIDVLVGNRKCCHHLHIPLQSGADEILARMNRRYGRDHYIELIDKLKSRMGDFSLTLDVMAGFPGETEEHFESTVDLLRKVRPLKSHVFPYSPREGTRAFWFESCHTEIIRRRVDYLIGLGASMGRDIRRFYEGTVQHVLVEQKIKRGGLLQGLTGNYLKVVFQGPAGLLGQMVPVRIVSAQGDCLLGVLYGEANESHS